MAEKTIATSSKQNAPPLLSSVYLLVLLGHSSEYSSRFVKRFPLIQIEVARLQAANRIAKEVADEEIDYQRKRARVSEKQVSKLQEQLREANQINSDWIAWSMRNLGYAPPRVPQ